MRTMREIFNRKLVRANSKLLSKEYFQQAFGTRPRRQASSDESVLQYAEEQQSAADKGIVLNANWNNPTLLLALGLGLLLVAGCQKPAAKEVKPTAVVDLQAVTICRSTTMLLPLVVAEKQGYFAAQGLTVTAREYPIGREALEAMLKGDCEFASAAEPPVVEYAMQRDDFRILSALQSSDNLSRLVARRDRGINTPTDLRGKRIATVKGTAPHYFLRLFLEKHGIGLNEVTVEFLPGDAMLAALSSDRVDAVAMTNNFIAKAQQAFGDKAVILEAPGLCRNYYMLLATSGLLDKRPQVAVQFLRALAQAEDLINQKPEEAQALASAYQGIPLTEIKQLWGMYLHHLSLDHAMLMGLEDTARWYVKQMDDSQRPVPNLMPLIHTESLRAVRPDAINLTK